MALFSALEQTRCRINISSWITLVVCDSEWMSVAFYFATFLNSHGSGVRATALFSCYMAGTRRETVVSAHVLFAPYNHAPVYTVTSCKAIHVGCTCINNSSCNLSTALWQTDWNIFTCHCCITGVEEMQKSESARTVDPRDRNSPAAPAGSRTRNLSITSPAP